MGVMWVWDGIATRTLSHVELYARVVRRVVFEDFDLSLSASPQFMYTQSCCEVFQYHSEVDAGQCPQQFSFENFLPQISSRTRLILWPGLLLQMLVTYWASRMVYSNLKRET